MKHQQPNRRAVGPMHILIFLRREEEFWQNQDRKQLIGMKKCKIMQHREGLEQGDLCVKSNFMS